jgi:DHA1 family bicyclomycin/chloramphenicol resistance-like MFS transporter
MTTAAINPGLIRIRLIAILGALTAIGPLSIDMYLPSLPSLSSDLHAATSEAQLTITACLAGLAAGQVLAGPVSDARGRRTPLLFGMTVYAVASMLCTRAPTIEILIALRFVQGTAGASGIVIARAMVRDLFEGADAARFFSTLMLVTGLGPVLAPVIGGQILRFTDWRGVFLLVGAAAVMIVLAGYLGLPETLPPSARRHGGLRETLRSFRTLLLDWRFDGLALAGGLAYAAMFTYISGSPFMVEGMYGRTPQEFSLIFAINGSGLFIFSMLNRRLVGHVPQRRLMTIGLVLQMAAGLTCLGALHDDMPLILVLPTLFLIVASIGLIMPNAQALALSGRPANLAGVTSALIGVTQYTFGAATAPLVGIDGGHTAMPMGLLIAGLTVMAVLSFVLLYRPKRIMPLSPGGPAFLPRQAARRPAWSASPSETVADPPVLISLAPPVRRPFTRPAAPHRAPKPAGTPGPLAWPPAWATIPSAFDPRRAGLPRELGEATTSTAIDKSGPVAQAARELGIDARSLGDWVYTHRHGPATPSSRLDDRIADLKKRLRELEVENVFLKKAAIYFASSHW